MKCLEFSALFFMSQAIFAAGLEFELPKDGINTVGKIQTITVESSISLDDVARLHGIGPLEIRQANPTANADGLLEPGETIVIPSQFKLPNIRNGLVIDLEALRLFLFSDSSSSVQTFPVAIGRPGVRMLLGETYVERKQKDPTWIPTPGVRDYMEKKHGIILPNSIGPGPRNPLGRYALYLGMPAIRIHGTDNPDSVGTRATSGCFRLYPEDIEKVYHQVPVGMAVNIIDKS